MKGLGIVGAGVVGTAIGVILSGRGYEVTGVYDRNPESTGLLRERTGARLESSPVDVARSSDILLVTTNDSEIGSVVEEIARHGGFKKGQLIVHMSGAFGSDVLNPARESGALAVSIHPLQTFADADKAIDNLPGSVFSIEGDPEAHALAAQLVQDLGGQSFVIDQALKPLYHAGACMVSNYLVTLIDAGLQLLETAGIPRQQALPALLPLVKGTVHNIERLGVPMALTGPVARGDRPTVTKHLSCLNDMAPHLTDLYCCLGIYTVEVAKAKGTIDQATADVFRDLFRVGSESDQNRGCLN